MNQTEYLSHFDGFSWRRVGMIIDYFRIRLARKLILFFCIPLFFSFMTGVALRTGNNDLGIQLFSVVSFFISFSALLIPTIRSQKLFLTMPALGAEKCVAIYLLFLLIIPIAIYLSSLLAVFLISGENIFLINKEVVDSITSVDKMWVTKAPVSTAAGITFVIWIVMASSTHRIAKGLLFSFGLNLLIGILTGLLAVGYTLSCGSVWLENIHNEAQAMEMMKPFMDMILDVMVYYSIILMAVSIVMGCRAICKKQM